MKKIEAVIRKSKYSEIKKALKENGVTFYTYWDVTGIGHETQEHVYRGIVYDASDIQRRYLSIVVNDDFEKITIETIMKVAQTGELGDGKIFVSDILQVYSIRTGEKGGETLRK
jgi:nitrogen regulatory protein P-II 1